MKSVILAVVILFLSANSSEAFAWRKSVSKDEMTDKKSTILVQSSEAPVWHGKEAVLAVKIQCDDHDILVLMHPWVVSDDHVSYRLDKAEATEAVAFSVGDHKTLELGIRGSAGNDGTDEIISQMEKSKRMVVRYQDAGGETFTASFNIVGLKQMVDRACSSR